MMYSVLADGKRVSVKPGAPILSNGKVFGVCGRCQQVVRMDGWLRGIHICKTNEEAAADRRAHD